ncbi:hypothetical protein K491DRAFT_693566 [Lophiostoma macrostomum CBS 122681]|uniref:Uncharacterized protein n=1 Tax=Lophiostoma macrostomum CBS 122681 TaxID=1314788 RepID=A0A6A6T871_9PLEO|nr:hypothetical protein K491DRAFT_693566 [Lophiostoma macrostomum CBS 122681]
MVNWNSDKDAKLLLGIFEFQEIKASQALLTHLANKIGEGCTPKAVSHRLNNLKKTGKTTATPTATPTKGTKSAKGATDDDDDGTPTPTPTPTSKFKPMPKVTAKPRGRPRTKKNDDLDGPSEENGFAGPASPVKGVKRGRGRKSTMLGSGDEAEEEEDAEEEGESKSKKIKVEAGDDFGSIFSDEPVPQMGYRVGLDLEFDDEGI